MRIQDIDSHLESLKSEAIAATGVNPSLADQIALAAPPSPDMGDRGFPCFSLAPHLKTSPQNIAETVAQHLRDLLSDDDIVAQVSTAGPYVNFTLDPARLAVLVIGQALQDAHGFGQGSPRDTRWMIEFSAPNTNKPQHLGHVRNNLLGDCVSSILEFSGLQITRVNLINDRGIHICKSMVAYELFSDGETPEDTGEKGDHFVGRYYVRFNREFADEYDAWQDTDQAEQRFQSWLDDEASIKWREKFADEPTRLRHKFFDHYENTYFNGDSDLGKLARTRLRQWEDGHEETLELWKRMNRWVLDGFDETYERLGIEFDRVYLESETYESGKELVREGLEKGLFATDESGAVVCDLEPLGLQGKKVLLRADGTTVYMTQDLGTADRRLRDYDPDHMVYVVGNEQEYHFDVLFRILAKLRPGLDERLHHLSYGMVELPEGKMKSREGKVVDADDLMDAMVELADEAIAQRYGDLDEDERKRRAEVIGLAALKFYVLDFGPRTTVQFDPQRSIDFQGRTGPYCLYSYARIASLERRLGGWPQLDDDALSALGTDKEMKVVRTLQTWPDTVETAATQLNPGRITEYLFELCSAFSSLYNDPDHRLVELQGERRQGLLLLAKATQHTIAAGLDLLGIPTLEEM